MRAKKTTLKPLPASEIVHAVKVATPQMTKGQSSMGRSKSGLTVNGPAALRNLGKPVRGMKAS
jgi:hypothetical protein